MTPFEQTAAIREAIKMSGDTATVFSLGDCLNGYGEPVSDRGFITYGDDDGYVEVSGVDAPEIAAFIVRACNSHRKLAEALEAAEAHFVRTFTAIAGGKDDAGRNFADADPVVQQIRTALSLAKGE